MKSAFFFLIKNVHLEGSSLGKPPAVMDRSPWLGSDQAEGRRCTP